MRRYFITYLVNTKDGRTIYMNNIVEIPRFSERAVHDMLMGLFNKHDAKGVTLLFIMRLEKDDVYDTRTISVASDRKEEKN